MNKSFTRQRSYETGKGYENKFMVNLGKVEAVAQKVYGVCQKRDLTPNQEGPRGTVKILPGRYWEVFTIFKQETEMIRFLFQNDNMRHSEKEKVGERG